MDTGKWRYLLAALNLWFIQSLTILAYFIPVTSFIICVYIMSYAFFNFRECRSKIKDLCHRKKRFFFFLAGTLLSAVLFIMYFIAKDPEVMSASQRRSADFSVSLSDFLTYGGSLGAAKWIETISRGSWIFDTTLYMGLITVFLAAYAIFFCINRKTLSLFMTAIIILSFTLARPTAVMAYQLWPLMKYYRHIGLVSPAVKLLLCFLAGFGFEAVFIKGLQARRKNIVLLVSFFFFYALTLFYFRISTNPAIAVMLQDFIGESQIRFAPPLMQGQFFRSALLAATLSVFWLFFFVFRKRSPMSLLIKTVLVLHVLDLYTYKFEQMKTRTWALSDKQYQETYFQKIPFVKRRRLSISGENPSRRIEVLKSIEDVLLGTPYCTLNAFFFADELGSSHVTQTLSKFLARYYRAYGGQDFQATDQPLPGYEKRQFTFPSDHRGALKISSVTEDKIQFFSAAHIEPEEKIADHITAPDYAGDILFVSSSPSIAKNLPLTHWSGQAPLTTDQRLRLPYRIKHFSSNHLHVVVDTKDREKAWFFYADTWHSRWQATVNQKKAPILRAHLAYKAIPLEKGFNDIHLTFASPLLSFLQFTLGLSCLVWMGLLLLLLRKVGIARDPSGTGPLLE